MRGLPLTLERTFFAVVIHCKENGRSSLCGVDCMLNPIAVLHQALWFVSGGDDDDADFEPNVLMRILVGPDPVEGYERVLDSFFDVAWQIAESLELSLKTSYQLRETNTEILVRRDAPFPDYLRVYQVGDPILRKVYDKLKYGCDNPRQFLASNLACLNALCSHLRPSDRNSRTVDLQYDGLTDIFEIHLTPCALDWFCASLRSVDDEQFSKELHDAFEKNSPGRKSQELPPRMLAILERLHASIWCGWCGEEATWRCAGCETIAYCSAEHAKKDWKQHKSWRVLFADR